MVTSIEQARRAKPKATEAAKSKAAVVGVGLTRIDGSYVVKVNLREPVASPRDLPDTIDGVTILYEVVGPIGRRPVGGA